MKVPNLSNICRDQRYFIKLNLKLDKLKSKHKSGKHPAARVDHDSSIINAPGKIFSPNFSMALPKRPDNYGPLRQPRPPPQPLPTATGHLEGRAPAVRQNSVIVNGILEDRIRETNREMLASEEGTAPRTRNRMLQLPSADIFNSSGDCSPSEDNASGPSRIQVLNVPPPQIQQNEAIQDRSRLSTVPRLCDAPA